MRSVVAQYIGVPYHMVSARFQASSPSGSGIGDGGGGCWSWTGGTVNIHSLLPSTYQLICTKDLLCNPTIECTICE